MDRGHNSKIKKNIYIYPLANLSIFHSTQTQWKWFNIKKANGRKCPQDLLREITSEGSSMGLCILPRVAVVIDDCSMHLWKSRGCSASLEGRLGARHKDGFHCLAEVFPDLPVKWRSDLKSFSNTLDKSHDLSCKYLKLLCSIRLLIVLSDTEPRHYFSHR